MGTDVSRFRWSPVRVALAAAGVAGGLLLLGFVFGSPRASAEDASGAATSPTTSVATVLPAPTAGHAVGTAIAEVTGAVAGSPAAVSNTVSDVSSSVDSHLGALDPVVGSALAPVTGLVNGLTGAAGSVATPVVSSAGDTVAGVVESLPIINVAATSGAPVSSTGPSAPGTPSSVWAVGASPSGGTAPAGALNATASGWIQCSHQSAAVVSGMGSTESAPGGGNTPGTPSAPSPGSAFAVVPASTLNGGTSPGPGANAPAEVTATSTPPDFGAGGPLRATDDGPSPSPAFEHDTTPD